MAHKVSKGGSFRLDRRFPPPVGRLAIATGATTRKEFRDVTSCITELARTGRLDVLEALKLRKLTVAQILDASRAKNASEALDKLLANLTLAPECAPLWPAVDGWLGPVEKRSVTVIRYATSMRKLKRIEVLPKNAPVSALADVGWSVLSKQWSASGTDWNQARRAVSRFLTVHLDDKWHPLRRKVMERFPKQREVERVPDLDVPTFWGVVEATPEHIRPAFVTLVALGLRVGEYLRLRETDLHPITKTVSVPGTKTAASSAVLSVDPTLWPWVVAAVPAPVGYHHLRQYWKGALQTAGADMTLRLHDLRHLTAQLLVNAGQSEASVQTTMRHATASMTRRYAKQRDRGENAAALARVLAVPQSVPQSLKTAAPRARTESA